MTSVLSNFAVGITYMLFVVDPEEDKVYSKPHAQIKPDERNCLGFIKKHPSSIEGV